MMSKRSLQPNRQPNQSRRKHTPGFPPKDVPDETSRPPSLFSKVPDGNAVQELTDANNAGMLGLTGQAKATFFRRLSGEPVPAPVAPQPPKIEDNYKSLSSILEGVKKDVGDYVGGLQQWFEKMCTLHRLENHDLTEQHQKELDQLVEDRDSIRKTLEADLKRCNDTATSERLEANDRIDKLCRSLSRERDEVQVLREAVMMKENGMDKLRKENDHCEDQLKSTQREREELESGVSDLRRDIASQRECIDELRAEIDKCEQQVSQYQVHTESLSAELRKATETEEVLKGENDRLQNAAQEQFTREAELERRALAGEEELKRLREEVYIVKESVSALENVKKELAACQSDKQKIDKARGGYKRENIRLRLEVERIQENTEKLAAKLLAPFLKTIDNSNPFTLDPSKVTTPNVTSRYSVTPSPSDPNIIEESGSARSLTFTRSTTKDEDNIVVGSNVQWSGQTCEEPIEIESDEEDEARTAIGGEEKSPYGSIFRHFIDEHYSPPPQNPTEVAKTSTNDAAPSHQHNPATASSKSEFDDSPGDVPAAKSCNAKRKTRHQSEESYRDDESGGTEGGGNSMSLLPQAVNSKRRRTRSKGKGKAK